MHAFRLTSCFYYKLKLTKVAFIILTIWKTQFRKSLLTKLFSKRTQRFTKKVSLRKMGSKSKFFLNAVIKILFVHCFRVLILYSRVVLKFSYYLIPYNLKTYILTLNHFTTIQFKSTTFSLLFSSLIQYVLTCSHFTTKINAVWLTLYANAVCYILTLITLKFILQLKHAP